ncbi:MAG: formyltetrahydrofolate deformylase [Candidatus Lokiarchaeota archaeon]|nr:formyltetrahydrofolate deformylase [Candidatus Lokiarchaeota archaeon]
METYILLVDCNDEKGLIHKITGVLYNQGLNIISNSEFVEEETNHFFMRSAFTGEINNKIIKSQLSDVLPSNSNIHLIKQKKKKIIVFATKEHHCLGDLLIKNEYNEMNAELLAIISNYPVLKSLVSKFKVPFHFSNHQNKTREDHEQEILKFVELYKPDYLVLAKYMRIFTPKFVTKFKNRIINIHHSFLPAFTGVNPYEQAFKRGVKIIGATSHFVSKDLDEGPIIVQEIVHIDHKYTVKDMKQAGREVEITALSKALKLVFEDRVFISNNKTIIFE